MSGKLRKKGNGRMRSKFRIAFDILLITASCIIFIYNILMQRRIVYLSSVIAVCGTTALLVRNIMALKREK